MKESLSILNLSLQYFPLVYVLQVGRDPRPVMREAYNMFKDGGDPEKVHVIKLYNNFWCCECLLVYAILLSLKDYFA